MKISMFIDPVYDLLIIESAFFFWSHNIVVLFGMRVFHIDKTTALFQMTAKTAKHAARPI